jgi:membrane fusion protein, multidrug efflux system
MDELIDKPSVKNQLGPAHTPSHAIRWIIGVAILAIGLAWLANSYRQRESTPGAGAPPLAQVVVAQPLTRELDSRMGFLGQFSAVDQVELRAQVGGTLTGISFKDGDIVQKGALLFTIDTVPYEIKLAQAKAQLETANARLALAEHELTRASALQYSNAGTVQNVEQRTSESQASHAAVEQANAQIRDAEFDLDHCRITAPFTGRIGARLVSTGSLIAGSRAATSPTTLLTTLVSLDPIYLDFDMSEADFLKFTRYQTAFKGKNVDGVEIALSDELKFSQKGVLDFINNVLDRSSGTIHARATVPNPNLVLRPGQFGRVSAVVAPPAQTLLVPDAAVLPDQSQHLAMTVSPEGIVVPKLLEIGDIRGGLRVVKAGLEPTDRVIIEGIAHVAPGAKVNAQDGAIHFAVSDRD